LIQELKIANLHLALDLDLDHYYLIFFQAKNQVIQQSKNQQVEKDQQIFLLLKIYFYNFFLFFMNKSIKSNIFQYLIRKQFVFSKFNKI